MKQSKYNTETLKIPENAGKHTDSLSESLSNIEDSQSVDETWKKYKQATASVAEQKLYFQGNPPRNYWFDTVCR